MSFDHLSAIYLPAIEAELKSVLSEAGGGPYAEYHEMLTYHLGWSGEGAGPGAAGKRIRPLLLELVCAAARGNWERALPAAASVELIHNFSLVHDDIQDNSPLRRGRPTVWTKWGVAQAINAGDALFSLARVSAGNLLDREIPAGIVLRVMTILDRTCLRLTQGQYLDMAFESRADVSPDEYWGMIEGKTAALLQACAEAGAVIAGANEESAAHFRDFGRALGLAFQIQDDLLGIWGSEAITGKSAASDLQTRKKSLPVVAGLSRSEGFRRLHATPPSPGDDLARMADLLAECGARALTEDEAARWTAVALDHYRRAGAAGPAADALLELAEQLLRRRL